MNESQNIREARVRDNGEAQSKRKEKVLWHRDPLLHNDSQTRAAAK